MRNGVFTAMTLLVQPGVLAAQEPETKADMQAKAEELAKAAQNPVANMVSIPVQFNWTTGGGLGDETQSDHQRPAGAAAGRSTTTGISSLGPSYRW